MPTTSREQFRLGLVGCGYVSKYHLAAGHALGVPIVAVCDRNPANALAVATKTGAKSFETPEALFRSGAVDGVIIATPHFSHIAIATAAIEAGLHVLIEKPLAVAVADVAPLIAAQRRRPDRAVAVNFNQRAWPLWRAVQQLVAGGTLGEVTRFQWTIADWYRTQHYYRQSTWRGTWAGEGGGLLVNQCPHQLDLMTWFFGLPKRVLATIRFGKHHDIEVEDEVHALLEFEGRLTGTFIATTGEPLGPNRLEIVGERGQLRVLSETSYELTTFATTVAAHTAANTSRSDPPEHIRRMVDVPTHEDEYRDVLANFIAACRGEETLLAPAADAVQSIEVANAILLSGCSGRSVSLPTETAAFTSLLRRLQETPPRATAIHMRNGEKR